MNNQDKNLFQLPDNGYLEEPVVAPQPEVLVEQPTTQDIAREEIAHLFSRRLHLLESEAPVAKEAIESSAFQEKVIRNLTDIRDNKLHSNRNQGQRLGFKHKLREIIGYELMPMTVHELINQEAQIGAQLFPGQNAQFYLGQDNRFHYAVLPHNYREGDAPALMLSYETYNEGTRKTTSQNGVVNFVHAISEDELKRLNETIAGYYQKVTSELYHSPDYIVPPHLDQDKLRAKIALEQTVARETEDAENEYSQLLVDDEFERGYHEIVDEANDDFGLAA